MPNYEFFDALTTEALRLGVRQSIADRKSEHARRMDAAYPTLHRKFQQALASTIPLAMGTDVGSPGQFHRNAIWWEFDSWVKHGASVDAALTAAAITGANVLYGKGTAGLREGARADNPSSTRVSPPPPTGTRLMLVGEYRVSNCVDVAAIVRRLQS